MTKEQQEYFKEILSYLLSASNSFHFGGPESFKDYLKNFKIAEDLFKQHFPDRPEKEIDAIFLNCRTLCSEWFNIPYMATFTCRREIWQHLLSDESNN